MTEYVKASGGGASAAGLREAVYGVGAPAPAPVAKTANFTPTVAEMLNRLMTVTSTGAVALTLPTGAVMDATLDDMPIDSSFDWDVINLGSSSGAITMTAAATGHTFVGNATQAIATSATYRTRKTAEATYVTYRVG